jgi:hypothetical protein
LGDCLRNKHKKIFSFFNAILNVFGFKKYKNRDIKAWAAANISLKLKIGIKHIIAFCSSHDSQD